MSSNHQKIFERQSWALALLPFLALTALRAHGASFDSPVTEQDDLAEELTTRIDQGPIKSAIFGALQSLDDTQIRQRWGLADPRYDACSGDGCAPIVPGTGQALPLPLPFTNNRQGEWANFINIFPDGLRWPGGEHQSLVQIQDSNMFVTAGIAYPLFLIDEEALPKAQKVAQEVRSAAVDSIRLYQRGPGFSFWPTLPGSTSSASRVGPLNIPMVLGRGQELMKVFPMKKPSNGNPVHREWSEDAQNASLNPYGVDALANIPNDVDDTSMALTVLELAHTFDGSQEPDKSIVEAMLPWRDRGRSMDDGRDGWRDRDSGAFLTWMKDENLPRAERFLTPESGVIPLGVNNVDCIVNANALMALGLSGLGDSQAALDASQAMLKAAATQAWPECGLYYPQKMMFPYALTRAYRDGGVQNPAMREAMGLLLQQLLADQKSVAAEHPERQGALSGGADHTYDLSTALGLTSLLNIGRGMAQEMGRAADYDAAIQSAVDYLVSHQKLAHIRFVSTMNRDNSHRFYPNPMDFARTWESGLFFSASKWNLAQWRSAAYTNAMVLESLTKYLLGYDRTQSGLRDGPRLRVKRYPRNADRAPTDFVVEIAF